MPSASGTGQKRNASGNGDLCFFTSTTYANSTCRGKPTQQEVEVIENHDEDDEDDDDDDDDISLDEAIRLSREQWERENQSRGQEDTESRRGDGKIAPPNARKVKRTGYFSDEEASD